jgi:5-methylcytosine-specific restriction protein A
MTEDVGTTPRKPLTPTQRLALFELFKGICVLCDCKIMAGQRWRDEHLRALGLGGSNALKNRAPVHEACADAKTFGPTGDLARIAKAKRQKMASLGIKPAGRKRIQSRGFAKAPPQKTASRPIVRRGDNP